MGTPLTSLQGWIERLRSRPAPPPGLADHLAADAERLERVAQRFERIGNVPGASRSAWAPWPTGWPPTSAPACRGTPTRSPWSSSLPATGPVVLGDPILLEWALEALVKNAIDALKGRSGTITLPPVWTIETRSCGCSDDGPGVPREIRRTLFEPGVTTKSGGWGSAWRWRVASSRTATAASWHSSPPSGGASFADPDTAA